MDFKGGPLPARFSQSPILYFLNTVPLVYAQACTLKFIVWERESLKLLIVDHIFKYYNLLIQLICLIVLQTENPTMLRDYSRALIFCL